jgi:hypothetical protein
MPFSLFDGETEWWVLGPDSQPVSSGIVPTREEAFAIALKHNNEHGVNAVYVHRVVGSGDDSRVQDGFFQWGEPATEAQITSLMEWEESPVEDEDFTKKLRHEDQLKEELESLMGKLYDVRKKQNDEFWEQMDKDFEEYKEKMAEGAYPEAEDVEKDVGQMKKAHPNASEEALRKLAVSAIAAEKRLKKIFKPSRKPMNKRKILTVVAMIAFGAIILAHYVGLLTYRDYDGSYHTQLNTAWAADWKYHGRGVFIPDVHMPLFVLAVFYAGLLFVLRKESESKT